MSDRSTFWQMLIRFFAIFYFNEILNLYLNGNALSVDCLLINFLQHMYFVDLAASGGHVYPHGGRLFLVEYAQ